MRRARAAVALRMPVSSVVVVVSTLLLSAAAAIIKRAEGINDAAADNAPVLPPPTPTLSDDGERRFSCDLISIICNALLFNY